VGVAIPSSDDGCGLSTLESSKSISPSESESEIEKRESESPLASSWFRSPHKPALKEQLAML
jgi:hypothetical protein